MEIKTKIRDKGQEVIQVVSLSLSLLLLIACNEKPMYEEYVEVSEQGWHADSVVNFTVEIDDTTAAYQVAWHLRNNNDYPYSNIFLFREVRSEKGIEFTDTAEFALANAYGKWLGEGVGELKTNTWPYKKQLLLFNEPGEYRFSLQQAMRTERLNGLEDIGLSIYKVTPENGKN